MKQIIRMLLVRLISVLCPVRRDKVLFFSYYGKQYGCNPKYLSQYMVSQGKWDVVWAFLHPEDKEISGVRKVRYASLRFLYELATSQVIITNYRMTETFEKRKGQFYVQTWHSSLRLKMIEKDAEQTLKTSYVEMAKHDSSQTDLLLSGCRYSTEIFKRCMWYDGEIAEVGTPRNDVLFSVDAKLKQNVFKSLGIESEYKLMLYAPTFRGNNSIECYNIDYNRLANTLHDRFGGKWKIAVRLHPHLSNLSDKLLGYYPDVIDATQYDDVQELIFAADVLISDYSSLMFDFAMKFKPCMLYVPDLESYTTKERGLYFDVEKLPFPICRTNDELNSAVFSFSQEDYLVKVKEFAKEIGSFEDGHASERTVKIIEERINIK